VKKRILDSALAIIGRKGGEKTASKLTPEQRKEKARKAGIASGKVRAKIAKENAEKDAKTGNAKKKRNSK